MSYEQPDPHTLEVSVSADASEEEVRQAIDDALAATFVELVKPAKRCFILHVKFGP